MGILWSVFFILAALSFPAEGAKKVEVKVVVPQNGAKPAGTPVSAGFNPFFMMTDRNFVRWSIVEDGISVITNGLMFATGIGLLNLRRWAVRWWTSLAWIKIVLLFLLWGYYIVGVAPGLAETMSRNVLAMFAQQGMPANKAPDMAFLTRVYSIFLLIMAVGAIVISSIYPAISLWLLSRPEVKAAVIDLPIMEPELP